MSSAPRDSSRRTPDVHLILADSDLQERVGEVLDEEHHRVADEGEPGHGHQCAAGAQRRDGAHSGRRMWMRQGGHDELLTVVQ